MKALSKHKWKIIIVVAVLAVLGLAFWYGGNAPGLQGWTASAPSAADSEPVEAAPSAGNSGENEMQEISAPPAETVTGTPEASAPLAEPSEQPSALPSVEPSAEMTIKPSPEESASPSPAPGSDSAQPMTPEEKIETAEAMTDGGSSEGVEEGDTDYSSDQGMDIDPNTGKDQYLTDPVPEGKPIPVEPQDAVITDNMMTCTLSVCCDTILDNISWLDPEKIELVPEDGVIFPATQVTFYEGESVFNVLLREMKKAGIHMEYVNTPMYNSAYIEGINNLYEFDCGELSGWMYKVNNWFPNYGCSRYQLKNGDVVEWIYTCNLGVDVGGYYSVG